MGRAYRVLVVEDEADVQLDIERELRAHGITVIGPANSQEAALQLIERETIDAAILDIRLGQEDSIAIADALSERGISFVFLSGRNEDVVPERHRERPFIAKPYPALLLANTVKSLIG